PPPLSSFSLSLSLSPGVLPPPSPSPAVSPIIPPTRPLLSHGPRFVPSYTAAKLGSFYGRPRQVVGSAGGGWGGGVQSSSVHDMMGDPGCPGEAMDVEKPSAFPAEGNGAGPSSVPCSICLELVSTDPRERSVAKLQCGHEFHLASLQIDCIGSAFNAKGVMQCPNCRKVEKGRWLYANGYRSFSEFNVDDLVNEGLYDLNYSEMELSLFVVGNVGAWALQIKLSYYSGKITRLAGDIQAFDTDPPSSNLSWLGTSLQLIEC
ncbi:hypothetical protein Taro_023258, partial [Colocasia esculenta]|nr:hypothetical protein [Colocasia esculenta]